MNGMPPPPGFPQGPGFDGPIPQFDTGGYNSDFGGDYDHGPQRGNSTKKNRDEKKKKNAPVEVQYEGFALEKAAPDQVDQKPNWSRVGRHPLPFADSKLAEVSRKVRIKYGMGPLTAFSKLSADQQGIITRLIAKRQQDEKSKDAEWVLDAVWKKIDKHYRTRTKECVKLNVIIKRQDRNFTTSSQRAATSGVNQFLPAEIIDLADPLPKTKKDKKDKRSKDHDDEDVWNSPGGGMPGGFDHGHGPHDAGVIDVPPRGQHGFPPPPQHGHPPQHHNQPPPPGAIPIGQFPPPLQQPQFPLPHEGNPFQPNAQFNHPGAFEMPPGINDQRPNQFQTRARTPMDGRHNSHSRSRSRSDERLRRRESERLERKLDDITDRLENIDMINKVADWDRGETRSSSDDSYRDRDDGWSADSRGWSTPPSSPGLSAVMADGPNGSLGRRGSKGYHPRRDSGYVGNAYPRDRDYGRRSAGQVVIEPHNSHSHRRIDYGHTRRRSDAQGLGLRYPNSPNAGSSPRRHGVSRPLLHHGNTWSGRDDYPREPYAERERLPRAIMQFPGEDWRTADFRRGGGRVRDGERRGGGGYYDERRGGGGGGGGRRERVYY